MLLELLLFAALLVCTYFFVQAFVLKLPRCQPRCQSAVKLHGKTAIVTGANTGIGKTTAMDLARRGARVILACRDRRRAEAAAQEIIQETGNSQVIFMQLDLASLKSVRSFADDFLRSESRLDLLINNAGVIIDGKTEDGFGMIFGVNHLGHFLLTALLLERLKASGPSRVVNVASLAYERGTVDFNCLTTQRDLALGNSDSQIFKKYCHSKLCNVLFTHELAKRLDGTDVTCYSLHPGGIRTEIGRNVGFWWGLVVKLVMFLFFVDVESGAQTTLHCALEPGIEHLSGYYFSMCAPKMDMESKARDDAAAKKLWELSESFCGLGTFRVSGEHQSQSGPSRTGRTGASRDSEAGAAGRTGEAPQVRPIRGAPLQVQDQTVTMLQLLLLAAVVLGGYVFLTRTLFRRAKCKGNAAMGGKTVIITGGNTGIGKATAMHLAKKGARVILACRNRSKAEAAIADIQQETGSTDVLYMQLDLASLKSVRCFTETFLKAESRLDLLINNAGLVADGRTEDGFGIEFGVNHLGHFLLTHLLLERLKEDGGGRVVTLSSMAYRWGHIDLEALAVNKHLGTGRYSWQFFQAYCNSKLCNVLFTHELAKRLKGTNVTCYSVHPGVVRTELSRHVSLWQKVFIEPVARLLFLDPEAGAQTTLHCALQEGIEPLSGRYFSCCGVQEVCAHARDDTVALKLWEVSEELCGLA
ncbi:protochlorophyllide reductase, chloroplastic-like [Plectropomus leopardus]|uniref:protochlorophyllide reductase, chloroplastic-like n=1 Tax=Plectropomus leopardus TaxID=160734 RepID=UPI001C4B1E2B|nr:protochlorophyllide reductase, chloroplastic-like [Plectropomus leopardus]